MENWQQTIQWHMHRYEKTGYIYHLASALTIFKINSPKHYEQWRTKIINEIGKPEPIRVK